MINQITGWGVVAILVGLVIFAVWVNIDSDNNPWKGA